MYNWSYQKKLKKLKKENKHMTLKELVTKLDRAYRSDVHYVSSILDDINEYVELGTLDTAPVVEISMFRKEEIERHYYEYVCYDSAPLSDFTSDNEKSALILEVSLADKPNTIWIDIVPNVDAWNYYCGD